MIDATNAVHQATLTVDDYAKFTLKTLCGLLDIDPDEKDFRKELAPFAGVWAAMITAAAQDFDTAVKSGHVTTDPP